MAAKPASNVWKTLKTEIIEGRTCELRYSEMGKGRGKMRFWRMFIDDQYFTYAAVDRDVEPNWRYTLASAAAPSDEVSA